MTDLPPDLPDHHDQPNDHGPLPDDEYELFDTDEFVLDVDQEEFSTDDEAWSAGSPDDGAFASASSDLDAELFPTDTDGTDDVVDDEPVDDPLDDEPVDEPLDDEPVDDERPIGLDVPDGDDHRGEIHLPVGEDDDAPPTDVSPGDQASDGTGSTDTELDADPEALEPDEQSDLYGLPDLGHGLCDASVVAHLADALGASIDAGELDELLGHALAADPDLAYGLDGRSAVRLLEDVGVSAGLEHGTLDTLTDHLRGGRVVMIGMGDASEGLRISAIDEESGSLTCLDAAGGGWEVDLDEFLVAWDEAASEMLLADELSSEAGSTVSLGAPGFTVLPMALPEGATPLIEAD